MANHDYYNTLGVDRRATNDEIKSAYRKLARQWHPDKNQGSDEALERFKEISEAYTTLSDPELRQRFNRLGPLYNPSGQPPDPEEISEALSNAFQNLFNRKRAKRGRDLKTTLTVSLEDVSNGAKRPLSLTVARRCHDCHGRGAPKSAITTCRTCDGNGRTKGILLGRQCVPCKGTGYQISQACHACRGDGLLTQKRTFEVTTPVGIVHGKRLKLAGRGDHAKSASHPDGDLFVEIQVSAHPLFTRTGNDIEFVLPITIAEAALGAHLEIPTLTGKTKIQIPKGCESGRTLKLTAKGIPNGNGGPTGDLLINIQVETPIHMSVKDADMLASWAQQVSEDSYPSRRAFRDALRSKQ
jgi:molecular chaperone DnaJ